MENHLQPMAPIDGDVTISHPDSISDVLDDKTIITHFGKNGKLNRAQQALLLAGQLKARERDVTRLQQHECSPDPDAEAPKKICLFGKKPWF